MEIYLGVSDKALNDYLNLSFKEKGANVVQLYKGDELKDNIIVVLDVFMTNNVKFKPVNDMSNIIIIDYEENLNNLCINNYHKTLSRPFTYDELNALIFEQNSVSLILKPLSISMMDKISIDENSRTISLNNEKVKLSKRQFALFMYLYKNKEKTCSRQELFEHIWGNDSSDMYVVDTYVCYLKKRIDSTLHYPNIKNVRNQGYILY